MRGTKKPPLGFVGLERSVHERGLLDLVSVGPATVGDLHMLGVQTVEQLAHCDASELYERLCEISGVQHDPCCQDVFSAAIAQARDPGLPEEQKKWWYWSKQRRAQGLKPAPKR